MQTLILLLALAPQSGAFIERHCTSCHGEDVQKGGLRLDTLKADFADLKAFATWVKVHDKVKAGEMPPPARKKQPTAAERDEATRTLAAALDRAGLARQATAGRVGYRRLNRVEYEYVLRDLLALPHLDVKDMLPPDDAAHGFDNVAEAQDVSYVQMSRYLEAAERAIDSAMCLRERPERTRRKFAFQETGRFCGKGVNPKTGKRVERGETRHVDEWVVFVRQPNSAQTPWRFGKSSPAGEYRFRVRCRGAVYDRGKILPADQNHVATIYTRGKRLLKTFDIPAEAKVVEFTAWLHEGDQLEFFCATLDDRNSAGAGTPKNPYTGPGIAVEYVELEGPLDTAWPWESHRRLFGDLPVEAWTPESGVKQPEFLNVAPPADGRGRPSRPKIKDLKHVVSRDPHRDAERLMRAFMKRAYRRPVEESEVERCLRFAKEAIDDKLAFQDAMRLAYQAALCSPDFLYFHETAGALDGYALASRLSAFLWRSAPDEKLRALAASGEIARPEVLAAQVDRLLDDPRSARFVEDFAGQWLDLRDLHFTVPDKVLYPEYFCDNHVVESMKLETEAYFAEMLRRDLPASSVVASDFVTINERLAEVYGIPGVKGSEIRKVALPKDSVRGGFLTQASVLKVTANGLTTSPVTRGAWVLERLLGTPAPPPPPGAGSIDPDTRGATTVREQLDKHRRDPSCASCHVKIDPPGFALESFDVMGAFRAHYRTNEKGKVVNLVARGRKAQYRIGPKVDASGKLGDGRGFAGVREFRRLLLGQKEQVARNLTERLLTFATGAGVAFPDRKVVDQFLARTRGKGHGVRSLIHEIVQSRLFRHK